MPDETEWGVVDLCVRIGDRLVLDSIDLPITKGAVTAVVGGDGAGKTTLLRAITGRVTPSSGSIATPDRRRIGYQSAASGTWANLTVDENLSLVARAYSLPTAEFKAWRDELLEAAVLTDAKTRLASELSGGMRQKLGVCMAMLHRPDLLILDEPSTGVDPVSRVELWSLIAQAASNGAAVVMATTYLDEAERVHHVTVLDDGVCLLRGTPSEVLAAVPGTVTDVDVVTAPRLSWRRGRSSRQWHPGPAEPGDFVVIPDMEDAVVAAALNRRGDGGVPLSVPAPNLADSPDVLVSAQAVTKRFGSVEVVKDVDLQVRPGEVVGLIGANGAGKTTLIRMLLGLLAPTSGRVVLMGQSPSRESRRRIGYVPQGLGLYGDLTVEENLAFSAGAYGAQAGVQGDLESVADDLVAAVGLGRQRQLAFAASLAHAPALLVLDEPTSGVDPISRARLWDTIHEQAELGAGLLVSTHYMQEAEQCDRLILMDLGVVVAQGSLADIIGTTSAVRVVTDQWARAFDALRAGGFAVALAGREVRVVDANPDDVRNALVASGVLGEVTVVPATLEEKMTAIARSRAAA